VIDAAAPPWRWTRVRIGCAPPGIAQSAGWDWQPGVSGGGRFGLLFRNPLGHRAASYRLQEHLARLRGRYNTTTGHLRGKPAHSGFFLSARRPSPG